MKVPRYQRQRDRNRSDRAICFVDGKRIYLGVYGSAESRRKFAAILKSLDEPAPVAEPLEPAAPSNPDVTHCAVRFMEGFAAEYYGGKGSKHYDHYRAAFKVVRKLFGDIPAKDFKAKALTSVQEAMVSKGWSRSYVNSQVQKLKRWLKWCVREELIPPDTLAIAEAVEGLKLGHTEARESDEVPPVDDRVFAATLRHITDEEIRDHLYVMRRSGARPDELLGIDPRDIDRSDDEEWVLELKHHKTKHHGKRRVIGFGRRCQRRLAKYLFGDVLFDIHPKTRQRHIDRACAKAFPHPTLEGKRKLTNSERAELKQWRAEHRWTVRQLRHSYATQAREVEGLDGVQASLSHSSAKMSEHYARVSGKARRRVTAKIG